MVVKPDQERVKTLLKDTITLLCKNGLSFTSKFSIEAVIGVTLDEDDVFLMSINELVKVEGAKSPAGVKEEASSPEGADSNCRKQNRRKRKHSQRSRHSSAAVESDSLTTDDGHTRDGGESQAGEPPTKHRPLSDGGDDSSRDVVYIKDEPSESWAPQSGSSQQLEDLPDFSTATFSQETDFPLLSASVSADTMTPAVWSGMESASSSAAVGTSIWSSNSSGRGFIRQGDVNQSQENSQMLASSKQWMNPSPAPPCEICGLTFNDHKILRDHKSNKHGVPSPKFVCPYCGKGYIYSRGLQGHMSWHTGIKEFKCHICRSEFRFKHNYKAHMKGHQASGTV